MGAPVPGRSPICMGMGEMSVLGAIEDAATGAGGVTYGAAVPDVVSATTSADIANPSFRNLARCGDLANPKGTQADAAASHKTAVRSDIIAFPR